MTYRLSELVNIRPGVYFKNGMHGDVYYLQPSNFLLDTTLDPRITASILENDSLKKHLLRKGDVLFAAKSNRNFATVYDGAIGAAVASAAFLVMEGNKSQRRILLPEYLVWFLMRPKTQRVLKTLSMGTALPTISISAIADLEIELPTLEIQHAIVSIQTLHAKERRLQAEIEESKNQLIDKLLFDIVQR